MPEIDQQRWIANWQIQQETCQEHGGPREECVDHERPWFPQRSICYATMAREAANRKYDEKHKDRPFHDGTFALDKRGRPVPGRWSKEYSEAFPYHYRDGVTVWVSTEDLTPDDTFI